MVPEDFTCNKGDGKNTHIMKAFLSHLGVCLHIIKYLTCIFNQTTCYFNVALEMRISYSTCEFLF